jgi:hypothetical protein
MNDELVLEEAARQRGQSGAAALTLLHGLHARLGHASYYVYRTERAAGAAGGASGRQRTLVAFPSGDAALAFAQRNRLGATPRLQRLSLARLLAALFQQHDLAAVLFVGEPPDDLAAGRLPEGLRLERAAALAALERGGELEC